MTGPSTSRRQALLLALHLALPLAVGWSLPAFLATRGAELSAGRPTVPRVLGQSEAESGMSAAPPPGAVPLRHGTWHLAGSAAWFGGIALAYTLDRLRPGTRVADSTANPLRRALVERHSRWLWLVAAVAGATTLVATLSEPRRLAPIVALLGLAALLHAVVTTRPVVKAAVVALAWTWGAAALPLAGDAPTPWGLLAVPVGAATLLLVFANVLLCDLKEATTASAGAPGTLAHDVERMRRLPPAAIASLAAVGLGLLAGAWPLALAAAGCVALATKPAALEREFVGPLLADALLLLPGIATLLA